MFQFRLLNFLRRHRLCLLFLSLLLPLAQASAGFHLASHGVLRDIGRSDGDPAVHQAQCAFCVAASAATSGAAPAMVQPLGQFAGAHQLPDTVCWEVPATPTPAAYQSRAPPAP